MNPLLLALLVSTSTSSRPLTPYETKLFRSLGECQALVKDMKEQHITCMSNLDEESRQRKNAESRLIGTPPPVSHTSSGSNTILRIIVSSGGAALGGVVASLVCSELNEPNGRAALIVGGSAGLVALAGIGVVALLE